MIVDMSLRRIALLLAIGMVAASCATAELAPAEPSTAPPSSTSATQASSTTGATQGSAETTPNIPAPDPNRPLAPDFELALGSGGTYVLSEDTRPVYLVFWAEW